jgi:hypothetical protein
MAPPTWLQGKAVVRQLTGTPRFACGEHMKTGNFLSIFGH